MTPKPNWDCAGSDEVECSDFGDDPAASPVTAGFEVSLDGEPRNPRQASLGAEANNERTAEK